MKTRILSLIVIAMTVLGTSAKAQSSAKEQKVLVAYFSRSGNTRAVADHIKSLTGVTYLKSKWQTPIRKNIMPARK